MSNLGGYQVMTTWTKRVGGPARVVIIGLLLIILFAFAGFYMGRQILFSSKQTQPALIEEGLEIRAEAAGTFHNVQIKKGETIRVLLSDNDMVLLRLPKQEDAMHIVPAAFVQQIATDFYTANSDAL